MRCVVLLCAVSIPMLVGCGSGVERSSTEKVTGTVSYKNAPLKTGTITFEPEKGRSAIGEIVDGKIVKVTTYEDDDGAVIGNHKVGITSTEADPKDSMKSTSRIPTKYATPANSGLTTTIKKGEPNDLKFDLND